MPSVLFLCQTLSVLAPSNPEIYRSLAEQVKGQTGADNLFVVLSEQAAALLPDTSGITRLIYPAPFEFERIYPIWGALRGRPLEAVVVCGANELADRQESIAANFLDAAHRRYVRIDGIQHDLSAWRDKVVMSSEIRPVQVNVVAAPEQDAYLRQVNGWAMKQLEENNYLMPDNVRGHQENLQHYEMPYLGLDLAMQTPHLFRDNFGRSWSDFMLYGRGLVHTADYHRALANFINAIPEVESVLDVGCGSGFVAFHLANNPRYRQVVGVDGAAARAGSAQFHASLHGNRAQYFHMDMGRLDFPDKSFDVTITTASLEQAQTFLEQAMAEIQRVTRRMAVLVEPTIEYFSNVPGQINVLKTGWARGHALYLLKYGRPFAIRPYLLTHYYNPVSMAIIDFADDAFPPQRYPQLFDLTTEGWPGGVVERSA